MNILLNTKASGVCPAAAGVLRGRSRQPWRGLSPLSAFLVALTLLSSAASAQEPAAKGTDSASGEAAVPSGDVEAERAPSAPVLVGGELPLRADLEAGAVYDDGPQYVRDGSGLVAVQKAGVAVAIISGRDSGAVRSQRNHPV